MGQYAEYQPAIGLLPDAKMCSVSRKNKGKYSKRFERTGPRAFPNVLAYCVSKAGVDQLTAVQHSSLRQRGFV